MTSMWHSSLQHRLKASLSTKLARDWTTDCTQCLHAWCARLHSACAQPRVLLKNVARGKGVWQVLQAQPEHLHYPARHFVTVQPR